MASPPRRPKELCGEARRGPTSASRDSSPLEDPALVVYVEHFGTSRAHLARLSKGKATLHAPPRWDFEWEILLKRRSSRETRPPTGTRSSQPLSTLSIQRRLKSNRCKICSKTLEFQIDSTMLSNLLMPIKQCGRLLPALIQVPVVEHIGHEQPHITPYDDVGWVPQLVHQCVQTCLLCQTVTLRNLLTLRVHLPHRSAR